MRTESAMMSALAMAVLLAGGGCAPKSGGTAGPVVEVVGGGSRAEAPFFQDFYGRMIRAVAEADVEASFGFYAGTFKGGADLGAVRRNIERLYADYKDAVYTVSRVRLSVQGDTAVTENDYTYRAVPRNPSSGLKPIELKGRERIYWVRENGIWKISDWVYY